MNKTKHSKDMWVCKIFGSRREGEQVSTTCLKSLEIENILGIPLCNHLLHWTTLISDTNAFKTQSSNA